MAKGKKTISLDRETCDLHVKGFDLELKQDFKALCNRSGLNLKDAINYLITKAVEQKTQMGYVAYRREKSK